MFYFIKPIKSIKENIKRCFQQFNKIPYSLLGIALSISTFFFVQTRCTAVTTPPHALKSVINMQHTKQNQWFNTQAQKAPDLTNKVVLIDFWTYSCINCIRTLPHMQKLHEKYASQGLVFIGVHSPEFEFEKTPENVKNAINHYKLTYPIIMDNEMSIWKSFDNHYWPAHYLFNRKGELIDTHFGEGNYFETENKIRQALSLAPLTQNDTNLNTSWNHQQSPETYMGLSRQENLVSPENPLVRQKIAFSSPKNIPLHHWALRGDWTNDLEFIRSESNHSELDFNFNSKNVYLVLGQDKTHVNLKNTNKETPTIDVYLDDVKIKTLSIKEHKLYTLIQKPQVTQGILTLRFNQTGINAYAFTFGD
jgi:thiol-disulfide isomerase/thioredoxin